MHAVVITGLGCVTPIGQSVAAFRESLFAGRSGIGPVRLPEGRVLRFKRAANVEPFAPENLLTSGQIAATERSAQFAIIAARQAAQDCQFLSAYAPEDIAIVLGCSVGGRTAEEPELARLYTENGRVHPLTVPRVMASSGASQISMELGITGPVLTISTACASSAHAIGQAFQMVRSGMVSAAIAGGHEAPLTLGFFSAWESLRVVSPTQCRPFAADRDGLTLGEGAAMLTLETEQRARERGAPIYARIAGFGLSSDASHITHPRVEGQAMAMRMALRDAGLAPEQIGYINAHGTGTLLNDRIEAEAIHQVFADRAPHIAVTSTKGLHGHTLGAAGAIEALATVLALHTGQLPGNGAGYATDASLNLNIPAATIRAMPEAALSNSFAFGGLNAALVFMPA